MSGWTAIKVRNVTLEHLSTSSQVLLTIMDDGVKDQEYWFDYAEFDALCECVAGISDVLVGPQSDMLDQFFGKDVCEILDKHLPADGTGTTREAARMALHHDISRLILKQKGDNHE